MKRRVNVRTLPLCLAVLTAAMSSATLAQESPAATETAEPTKPVAPEPSAKRRAVPDIRFQPSVRPRPRQDNGKFGQPRYRPPVTQALPDASSRPRIAVNPRTGQVYLQIRPGSNVYLNPATGQYQHAPGNRRLGNPGTGRLVR